MRGYPLYNFPLFDAATISLRAKGHHVISPAELDREIGFDGTGELPLNFLRIAFPRDVQAIAECDSMVMLPGWRRSKGASIEHAIAEMFGLRIFYSLNDVPTLTGRTPHAHA